MCMQLVPGHFSPPLWLGYEASVCVCVFVSRCVSSPGVWVSVQAHVFIPIGYYPYDQGYLVIKVGIRQPLTTFNLKQESNMY